MRQVRDCVATMFEVRPELLPAASRRQDVVRCRQLAVWICARTFPQLSSTQLGILFGGRDHTTILYTLDRIESRRRAESSFRILSDAVLNAIGVPPALERPTDERLQNINRIAMDLLPDHTRRTADWFEAYS